MNTGEDVLKCQLDVTSVKSRRLDEGQIVLTCKLVSDKVTSKASRNSLANCLASSVGTARRCRRSLLFPTSIMTMLASA